MCPHVPSACPQVPPHAPHRDPELSGLGLPGGRNRGAQGRVHREGHVRVVDSMGAGCADAMHVRYEVRYDHCDVRNAVRCDTRYDLC